MPARSYVTWHIWRDFHLTHSPYTKASLSSCTLCLPQNWRYKSACQIIHRFLLCQSDVTPPWLLEINKNRSSGRSNTYCITFFLVFVIFNFKRFETRKFGALPSWSIEYNWEPNSLPKKGYLSQGCHSRLRSWIPDIPDIILTLSTKNSWYFQCKLERVRTDFRTHKTNNNNSTFEMLKQNIKKRLNVYLNKLCG